MHDDRLRYHHAAQHDLAALLHRFYLIFGNLGRIGTI